jgi:hypothetical protein
MHRNTRDLEPYPTRVFVDAMSATKTRVEITAEYIGQQSRGYTKTPALIIYR